MKKNNFCESKFISVEDHLPNFSTIVNVRTNSGKDLKAYFHHDKMYPLARYWKGHTLSHWQEYETRNWLYDVTHWKELNEK